MAYASEARVLAYMSEAPAALTSSTTPTTAQVVDWIATEEALLDARLASVGYTVPVTGATPVLALSGISARRVAANGEDLRHNGRGSGSLDPGESETYADKLRKVADALLDALLDPPESLYRLGVTSGYTPVGLGAASSLQVEIPDPTDDRPDEQRNPGPTVTASMDL